ncbi:cation:proton antiporter [Nitrosomonas sp.]|uniref:cation:proton antiporter domain-containing protein n=1 Tax=Nitrosomonas sp. TaxID=42353 RepID=UPI00345D9492
MEIIPDIFTEMALLLLLAVTMGALGVHLRQPLIVSFIAVGILAGPSALGWVNANDQIDLLAKLGITLLLFVVGLKLDLHIIRTMGPVALATGLGQVTFTSIIGYFIAVAFGMSPITALYVAVALTFSSTIIIVKLLSDKREVDTLHGRIALGFLIVQDLVVVLTMIGLNALASASIDGASIGLEVLEISFKGILFLVVVGVATRYVRAKITSFTFTFTRTLGPVWYCLGRGFSSSGRHARFQQRSGCFHSRRVFSFHTLSGRPRGAPRKPA